MKIVITQPTYLSWIGYYGMINLADIFVFYDDVQFERRSWQNRNKISKNNGESQWLTIPIIHNGQNEKINEVKIDYSTNWREKHWKSIYYSYCKSPYFEMYQNEIKSIYMNKYDTISDFNIFIIKKIAKLLNINLPKFVISSEIEGVFGEKTDRLINILEKIGGDEYISTIGTKAYLETDKFKDKNIDLYWYDYQNTVYGQMNLEFVPYLSVIDLLFNVGPDSLKIINKGLENSLELVK